MPPRWQQLESGRSKAEPGAVEVSILPELSSFNRECRVLGPATIAWSYYPRARCRASDLAHLREAQLCGENPATHLLRVGGMGAL